MVTTEGSTEAPTTEAATTEAATTVAETTLGLSTAAPTTEVTTGWSFVAHMFNIYSKLSIYQVLRVNEPKWNCKWKLQLLETSKCV